MQILEVPKQVEFFFKRRDANPDVLLGSIRIQVAQAVDAHRRHLSDRSIERCRLAARGIFRIVDALTRQRQTHRHENQTSKGNLPVHFGFVIRILPGSQLLKETGTDVKQLERSQKPRSQNGLFPILASGFLASGFFLIVLRLSPNCWCARARSDKIGREASMKHYLLTLFMLVAAPLAAQQNVPEIPFDSVPDFFKLPQGMNFGEVPGVAVDSRGHVYVFTRSNTATGPAYAPAAAQLFEFGPKGEFVREIGKGLYAWSEAHTVRIDKNDNIWAIDKGSDMVIKFNQAGRVMMVFGRRKESADEESKPWLHPNPPLPAVDGLFRQPTDVAWDSEGNIYISDGYINSRVAKYDKNGDWVKSWGTKGNGPGQFNLPHAIVIDRNNNIYVGDRSNRRVQVFDTDGKFLRMFTIDVPPPPGIPPVNGETPTGARLAAVIGAPNSICITPGTNQMLYIGESTYPGRLFKVSLDGKVLGVIGRSGRQLKQFSGVHQLACASETEVYAAETSNWRVQKLILRPAAQTSSASR